MIVVVCCPLCAEQWEAAGKPGWAATVMVVCPRCGHVFDVERPVVEGEQADA